MDDDWASEGEEEGLGDLSDIPDVDLPVQIKTPLPEPTPQPPAPVVPRQNAWTKPNQSQQVRSAVQSPAQHQQQPQGRALHRRQNSFPASFGSNLERPSQPAPRHQPRSHTGPTTTLYVTNLPYQTHEQAIGDFFTASSVHVVGIRLVKHPDTGNIRAALVTVVADHVPKALAVDGRMFGGRTIYVKIDGTDGKRGARGERSQSRNPSFGSSFGTRAPPLNGNARSSSWHDRGPGHSIDSQLTRRASDNRDDRRSRLAPLAKDPSIPVGPPPAGRKKLQLMPRTKPPPELQVDQRAISQQKPPQSAMPAPGRQDSEKFSQNRAGPPPRRVNSYGGERSSTRGDRSSDRFDRVDRRDRGPRMDDSRNKWTNSKETATSRPSSQPTAKKEDDSKRPVLQNTFAALDIKDPDA
ncbi:hypothetical protein BWQ96_04528 [Gracilariopsis chorda]|uniref:RRM domain-containing protein n=1 Tax=Gracilariopsis chorda TaxID=448386 RepID=A0A2V3IX96_9FLOR|nr:hypothetical protein BWQ96_04528 [Gracilariopsis chorda]|eukprot:PXF45760.1 hypothetical protein BWQ96_04528 [Gracilariopsis chorda]